MHSFWYNLVFVNTGRYWYNPEKKAHLYQWNNPDRSKVDYSDQAHYFLRQMASCRYNTVWRGQRLRKGKHIAFVDTCQVRNFSLLALTL